MAQTGQDERESRVVLLREKTAEIIAGSAVCDEQVENLLWQALREIEGRSYYTSKKLEYTYRIRGKEMFVSRKEKSITKSTVVLAFRKGLEIQKTGEKVKGPKKLGTFGASYLYPIFQELGII